MGSSMMIRSTVVYRQRRMIFSLLSIVLTFFVLSDALPDEHSHVSDVLLEQGSIVNEMDVGRRVLKTKTKTITKTKKGTMSKVKKSSSGSKTASSTDINGTSFNSTSKSSSSKSSKSSKSKSTKSKSKSKSSKSSKSTPKVAMTENFYSQIQNGTDSAYDFTLVLQGSMDRAWMVPHICDRWHGPIKLVLYKVHHEDPQLSFLPNGAKFAANTTKHHHELSEEDMKGKCPNIDIAVLFAKSRGAEYPVNKLRNMGIEAVSTTHYMLADIDFVPDNFIYESLLALSSKHEEIFSNPHLGLVVPAFRITSVSTDCYTAHSAKCAPIFMSAIPRSFAQLLECVSLNICRIFDYTSNPEGHTTTDYPRMMRMETPMLFEVNCFNSNKYEPYLVLQKESSPRYDEHFEGYGKNKIELVMRLRALGYSFRVMPQSFLVHTPHPRSVSKKNWKGSKRSENLKLLSDTKTQLKVHSKAVGICKPGGRVQDLYKDHDPWTAAVLASVYTLKNNEEVNDPKYRAFLKSTFHRKPKPPCDNRQLCY